MNLDHLTQTLHTACHADYCGTKLQEQIDELFEHHSDEWRANLYATIWDRSRTYGSILVTLSRSLSNV